MEPPNSLVAIVGCGGVGLSLLRPCLEWAPQADCIAVDRDRSALEDFPSTRKIDWQWDGDRGEAALLEAVDWSPYGLVIFLAGLGRCTGTEATVSLARAARAGGALTVALVTTPFASESWVAQELTRAGLTRLERITDAVSTFSMQQYRRRCASASDSGAAAQEEISHLAAGLAGMVLGPNIIHVDRTDLRSALAPAGQPFLLWASGRVSEAAELVIRRALAETGQTQGWSGATRLLLHLKMGLETRLDQVYQIADVASSIIGRRTCQTVFGVALAPEMADYWEIFAVASGPDLLRRDPLSLSEEELDFPKFSRGTPP